MRRNRRHFCGVPCYRLWWKVNVAKRGPNSPKWRGGMWVQKMCIHCETVYTVSRTIAPRSNFCSHACRAKFYFTGEGNVNWKGGVTPKHWAIRQTREYAEWRRDVYRRDRWTCQACGYRGRQIVAHHIKSFAENPALRFDVENGMTLCRPCHATLENPQRLARPTRESVKIQSDLHGDVERLTETMSPAAFNCW